MLHRLIHIASILGPLKGQDKGWSNEDDHIEQGDKSTFLYTPISSCFHKRLDIGIFWEPFVYFFVLVRLLGIFLIP